MLFIGRARLASYAPFCKSLDTQSSESTSSVMKIYHTCPLHNPALRRENHHLAARPSPSAIADTVLVVCTPAHSLPVIVTPAPTSPAPPAVPAPAPALVLLRVRVPRQRADDGAAERADSGAQQHVADYAAGAGAEEAVA